MDKMFLYIVANRQIMHMICILWHLTYLVVAALMKIKNEHLHKILIKISKRWSKSNIINWLSVHQPPNLYFHFAILLIALAHSSTASSYLFFMFVIFINYKFIKSCTDNKTYNLYTACLLGRICTNYLIQLWFSCWFEIMQIECFEFIPCHLCLPREHIKDYYFLYKLYGKVIFFRLRKLSGLEHSHVNVYNNKETNPAI